MSDDRKPRNRNVAHAWWDKRVLRFFRSNFDRRDSKNLHLVYLSLCEVESDFCESKTIKSFSTTVAKYASMDDDVVACYLRSLQKGEFVDYWQQNEGGNFGSTYLELYEFDPSIQATEDNIRKMKAVIERKSGWRKNDSLMEEKVTPSPDLSGHGYIGPHKDKNGDKDSPDGDRKYPSDTLPGGFVRTRHLSRMEVDWKKEVKRLRREFRSDRTYCPEFESFWAVYPSRPGNPKGGAYKRWMQVIEMGVLPHVLEEGAKRYRDHCEAENKEPKYIKQALNWLNPDNEFWNDPWKVSNGNGNGNGHRKVKYLPEGYKHAKGKEW